jgi:hypothetical protein
MTPFPLGSEAYSEDSCCYSFELAAKGSFPAAHHYERIPRRGMKLRKNTLPGGNSETLRSFYIFLHMAGVLAEKQARRIQGNMLHLADFLADRYDSWFTDALSGTHS